MFTLDGKLVYELSELDKALEGFRKDQYLSFDIETSGLRFETDVIATIQLSGAASGTSLLAHLRGAAIPSGLCDLFSDPSKTFIGHNLEAFDMLFLGRAGIDVLAGQTWFDTLVAEWVITPSGRKNVKKNLKATLKRRLDVNVDKEVEHSWMNATLTDQQKSYAMRDVFHLHDLMNEQKRIAARNRQAETLSFEIALVPLFASMTLHGIPVDMDRLVEYSEQQRKVAAEKNQQLIDSYGWPNTEKRCKVCGSAAYRVRTDDPAPSNNAKMRAAYQYVTNRYEWRCLNGCLWAEAADLGNAGSWKQKIDALLAVGIPERLLTVVDPQTKKTKLSSDKNVLKMARTELRISADEIDAHLGTHKSMPSNARKDLQDSVKRHRHIAAYIDVLLDFQYAQTRVSMWGNPEWQREHIYTRRIESNEVACLHPRFGQCKADTGRVISSDPNGQQIPQDARTIFGWIKGYKVITLDYSGIETVVAAKVFGEDTLRAALYEEDFHTSTASGIYNKPAIRLSKHPEIVDELQGITEKQRQMAKGASFLLLFGGGWRLLYDYAWLQGMHPTVDEIKAIYNGFYERYPQLWRARQKAIDLCNTEDQIWLTLANGFKRLLIGEDKKPTTVLNTLVQGTAGIGIKRAMLDLLTGDVRKKWIQRGYDPARMLFLQVHDELVFLAPESIADELASDLQQLMVDGMLKVLPDMPVKVGKEVSDSWVK